MKVRTRHLETDNLDGILERYRMLAAESQEAADSEVVPGSYRKAYLKMAKHWTELADELEEMLRIPRSVH